MKEVKEDIEKCESEIKEIIQKFIKKHGNCDINLESECLYRSEPGTKRQSLIRVDIKMNVTI